ncbi:MAG: chromate transporter [Clostridia bacterium]|nr:chromate transporter [Clostridia bacterium]
MNKLKSLLSLFLTMFKIGLFTFGGGYAMIAIIERELVEKKGVLNKDEYLDIISIAESTPGPIAVNTATFIGYKSGGFFGSVFATLGVVLPSFIIIFIISIFFRAFLSIKVVAYAFKGIEVAVAFIILTAGIKLFNGIKKTPFNIVLMALTVVSVITCSVFAISFSSIYYILIGGFIGIVFYIIAFIREKKFEKKNNDNGGNK